SLIYTALTYKVADAIESRRVEVDRSVACSYRIKTTPGGYFFHNDKGYESFFNKCFELNNRYSYVLATDINNFYNSIYLHRLQNPIESCDPNLEEVSKAIEDFLLSLNNGPSIGIPVGPAPSIVMAEALMIDVDEFILDKEIQYVRYVDDLRLFSNSLNELRMLLADLTHYLYNVHRLTLSSSKT